MIVLSSADTVDERIEQGQSQKGNTRAGHFDLHRFTYRCS